MKFEIHHTVFVILMSIITCISFLYYMIIFILKILLLKKNKGKKMNLTKKNPEYEIKYNTEEEYKKYIKDLEKSIELIDKSKQEVLRKINETNDEIKKIKETENVKNNINEKVIESIIENDINQNEHKKEKSELVSKKTLNDIILMSNQDKRLVIHPYQKSPFQQKLIKYENFKVDKLGWYRDTSGEEHECIKIFEGYSYFLTKNNSSEGFQLDKFSIDGIILNEKNEIICELVEYLPEESKIITKEPMKFRFESKILSQQDHIGGATICLTNYDLNEYESIRKWNITMEEIIE